MKKEYSKEQYIIEMENGGQIALYRLNNPKPTGFPIIIAHGTISNADTVRDLGLYLVALGFDCWLLEWGGHGQSIASCKRQNFEYPALNDVPAGVNTILKITEQKQIYWVSHSGGGHLPLMYLARNPEYQRRIAGLVTIGAQATDAALGFKYKIRAYFLWWVTNIFSQTPKVIVSVGTEGEPTRLLAQWAKWNLQRKWLGKDGFNYVIGLSRLTIPAFMLAGSKDDIAPVSGCKKLYEALGSSDKSWLVCSVLNGFSKDYTHGQLIRGHAAKNEVFPQIGDWLLQRNAIYCKSKGMCNV